MVLNFAIGSSFFVLALLPLPDKGTPTAAHKLRYTAYILLLPGITISTSGCSRQQKESTRLRQVAEGVLIDESEFMQSNAVVVQGRPGVLLITSGYSTPKGLSSRTTFAS